MVFITAEAYKNAGVSVIKDNETDDYFLVKMKDVENGLGLKRVSDILTKQMQSIFETKKLTEARKRIYRKSKYALTRNKKDNNKIKYVRNDIAERERVIKNCRGVKKVMMIQTD